MYRNKIHKKSMYSHEIVHISTAAPIILYPLYYSQPLLPSNVSPKMLPAQNDIFNVLKHTKKKSQIFLKQNFQQQEVDI